MNKSYVIQWKSTINGRAGKGTKIFDLEEATRLAEELNLGYPGIHHEVVEASLSSEPDPVLEPAAAEVGPSQQEPAEETEAAAEVAGLVQSPDVAFAA